MIVKRERQLFVGPSWKWVKSQSWPLASNSSILSKLGILYFLQHLFCTNHVLRHWNKTLWSLQKEVRERMNFLQVWGAYSFFLFCKWSISELWAPEMSIFFQTVFTRRTIIFLDIIFHCARCAMKDKKVINCLESKVIHCVDAPFGLGNPYAIFRGGFQKLFRKWKFQFWTYVENHPNVV